MNKILKQIIAYDSVCLHVCCKQIPVHSMNARTQQKHEEYNNDWCLDFTQAEALITSCAV